MPEFVMEGRDESAREESAFVHGFIEVMFFTNVANGESRAKWWNKRVQKDLEAGRLDGCLPEDSGYHDLSEGALKRIRAFCEAWQEKHADLIQRVLERNDDYDSTQLGRDFFYTHCGHGVGFSDRDELDDDSKQELDAVAGYGDVNPYFGRDGKISIDMY